MGSLWIGRYFRIDVYIPIRVDVPIGVDVSVDLDIPVAVEATRMPQALPCTCLKPCPRPRRPAAWHRAPMPRHARLSVSFVPA